EGNTVVPGHVFDEFLAPVTGRELTSADLQPATMAVATYYHTLGYFLAEAVFASKRRTNRTAFVLPGSLPSLGNPGRRDRRWLRAGQSGRHRGLGRDGPPGGCGSRPVRLRSPFVGRRGRALIARDFAHAQQSGGIGRSTGRLVFRHPRPGKQPAMARTGIRKLRSDRGRGRHHRGVHGQEGRIALDGRSGDAPFMDLRAGSCFPRVVLTSSTGRSSTTSSLTPTSLASLRS